MNRKLHYFLMIVSLLCIQAIVAQQTTVSGTVTDASGTPLPGVNVVEKGTTNGASTDFDGNYSLRVSDDAVLTFSYIGFLSKEVTVGNQTTINVSLDEDTEQLGEVVVTALGIKREKKALGFSVQEIQGGEIVGAKENNLTNALSGKVAGLQVIRGSNGPASSSKLILRGFNSLSPQNEPLIVVDGVPIDNFNENTPGFFNGTRDRGNGLGDLNPDAIESISVLKGASAAALYGSRAGNGVVLITTKTGRETDGIGISYSSSLGISTLNNTIDLQSSFGQGLDGIHDAESGSSWGPKIEGQTITNYAGEQEQLRAYDNIGSFFKTGITQTHTLSFQQQVTDATSVFTSINYLNDDSMTPGAKYERLNLLARTLSHFGPNKRWTTDFKVEYVNTIGKNRPIAGETTSNYFRTVFTLPRTLNIRDFEQTTDEFGNVRWWSPTVNTVNPFWASVNDNSEDNRRRFLLNGALKYKFTDWLNAEVRLGADMHRTRDENKLNAGSALGETGRYSIAERNYIETNYSFLITAQKDNLFGKFGGAANLGGNLLDFRRDGLTASAGGLDVPNLFAINNGLNPTTVSETFSTKKINSLYGTLQLNYDGYLFVEFTGRNDWSSALSKENRSFFYPSVSGSLVVTDFIKNNGGNLPNWFSFAKLRASYAEVGNDLDPFQLINFFNIGKDPNGVTTASPNSTLNDPDIKSELIKSTEFGADFRFLNNRLGIDFTWYKTNATNQILTLPLDPFSGFNNFRVNAGDIQNKGIELAVNADIFQNPEGFAWNVNLNYSKNENTIVELTDEIENFTLGSFDRASIRATAGGDYGDIYGSQFLRVKDENDPNFGRIVVDGNGIPVQDQDEPNAILGNQQPDALIGLTNTFGYKNFTLSFLLDARIGGEMFSGTNRFTQSVGASATTVVNGERNDFVFDGVVDDGNGGFTENTTAVSPQDFYNSVNTQGSNVGIVEHNIYDATNFRIRTASLDYRVPSSWLKNTGIQGAKLGVTMTNVWLISSKMNGVDPDSVFSTGTNATGFENLLSPTARTTFFNVSLNF